MTRKPAATTPTAESGPRYLLAEYCPADFYMGWWLYTRDRNDGSPNDDGQWGWHRGSDAGESVRRFVLTLGPYDPPETGNHSQKFAEWFAATFPAGLKIESSREGWKLVEIIAKMPKLVSPKIIRTVARANRSFAKACRKYQAQKARRA